MLEQSSHNLHTLPAIWLAGVRYPWVCSEISQQLQHICLDNYVPSPRLLQVICRFTMISGLKSNPAKLEDKGNQLKYTKMQQHGPI